MRRLFKQQWILGIVSCLLAVFLSSTAFAQIEGQGSNIMQMGGSVVVPANQTVENAIAVGGNVTIEPGARVIDTAIAVGGNVTVKPGARVEGDAYAVGGKVIIEPGAAVGGAVGNLPQDSQNRPPQDPWDGMERVGSPFYVLSTLSHLLTALIGALVGYLFLRFRPNFLPSLAAVVRETPGKAILLGIGGSLALILLAMFLLFSLLGIPLIPLVGLVAFIAPLIGALGVALWVGQLVLKEADRSNLQQFLIGLLIITGIGLIPVLGGLALWLVNLLGFGALLTLWLDGRRRTPQVVPTLPPTEQVEDRIP